MGSDAESQVNALLMYHDNRRAEMAALSTPGAREIAERHKMEFVLCCQPEFTEPHAIKPTLIGAALGSHPVVIYSDVDVLFRPGAVMTWEFTTPILISQDSYGLCTGFIVLRREPQVERLLRAWTLLGIPDNSKEFEQATFRLLYERYAWVRNLVTFIPTEVVSNPHCDKAGSLAHHFWHHGLEYMRDFDWNCDPTSFWK